MRISGDTAAIEMVRRERIKRQQEVIKLALSRISDQACTPSVALLHGIRVLLDAVVEAECAEV